MVKNVKKEQSALLSFPLLLHNIRVITYPSIYFESQTLPNPQQSSRVMVPRALIHLGHLFWSCYKSNNIPLWSGAPRLSTPFSSAVQKIVDYFRHYFGHHNIYTLHTLIKCQMWLKLSSNQNIIFALKYYTLDKHLTSWSILKS